jgi:membrane protease YdiL (CAAX protease family)
VQAYEFAFGHPPPSAISPLRAAGVTVVSLLNAAVNPFFEELIVRAFLIAEATLLTGSVAFAVAISVSLQTSYHKYQGIPNATGLGFVFLVFSIYYVRTRRLWPIIIAHLWSDLSALLWYSVHVHR